MTYLNYKNYKTATTTNSSTQTTTTAGIVVNGLIFDYVPASNSSKIILEYSFYAEKDYGIPFLYTKIEYSDDGGSSWSDFGQYQKIYSCSGSFNNFYVHYKAICNLGAWVGERKIRVKAFEHNYSGSTNVSVLHYLSDLSEYINTNYLIYSEQ